MTSWYVSMRIMIWWYCIDISRYDFSFTILIPSFITQCCTKNCFMLLPNTYTSLYKMANSFFSFTRKALVLPGWSISWTIAAIKQDISSNWSKTAYNTINIKHEYKWYKIKLMKLLRINLHTIHQNF